MGRKLIEKGYIKLGRNSLKKISDNKYVILNSRGVSSYDWVTGDNPSEEQESKMCSMLFYSNLQALKRQTAETLEKSFFRDLYVMSDTGSDAIRLANHFIDGNGELFVFNAESNIVNEIKNSSQFLIFKERLLRKLQSEIRDGSLKKEKKDGTYDILTIDDVSLPFYGLSDAVGKNDDVATFVGGLQLCIIEYELYRDNNQYIVYITKYMFYDTFGAGWDDACGTKKSLLSSGLVSMFVLQHYKNIEMPNKYQPFVVAIVF